MITKDEIAKNTITTIDWDKKLFTVEYFIVGETPCKITFRDNKKEIGVLMNKQPIKFDPKIRKLIQRKLYDQVFGKEIQVVFENILSIIEKNIAHIEKTKTFNGKPIKKIELYPLAKMKGIEPPTEKQVEERKIIIPNR